LPKLHSCLKTRRKEPAKRSFRPGGLTSPGAAASARRWGKNEERDGILVAMRDRGEPTEAILREFDKRAIAGIPAMTKRGVVHWVEAYQDVDLMIRIDQVLDKAYKRRRPVKR
jgi:hypothetical protein